MKNNTGTEVELAAEPVITVNSTYQLGGVSGTICTKTINVWSVDQEWSEKIIIPHGMYKDKLAPDGMGFIRAIGLVSVKNADKIDTFSDQFDIDVEIPEKMVDINVRDKSIFCVRDCPEINPVFGRIRVQITSTLSVHQPIL